jgi:hypothetical protein
LSCAVLRFDGQALRVRDYTRGGALPGVDCVQPAGMERTEFVGIWYERFGVTSTNRIRRVLMVRSTVQSSCMSIVPGRVQGALSLDKPGAGYESLVFGGLPMAVSRLRMRVSTFPCRAVVLLVRGCALVSAGRSAIYCVKSFGASGLL